MVNMDQVELLAKMENVLQIPAKERLTRWYGDYNIYEPKSDVTQKDIDKRIKELEEQIKHNRSIKVEIKETLSRTITIENPLNIREAVDTVMEQYNNRKIVLNADDFQGVEFLHEEIDFNMEM